MNLLFLAGTALLLLLHLVGAGLLLSRLTPHPGLAKPVAVVGGCLLLFFVEHFVGLGRLDWLWPLTSAGAAWLCWRHRVALRRQWPAELAFVAGFAYAFAWRFMFPNIDPSSEHLTDLAFIVNYLPGERLPPVDHWLPAYRFDFYYAFQHYAAALLGRLFGLDSGTTYNFAFCVLVGLIVGTAWFVAGQWGARPAARGLLLFAFVLGGTGVSPLVHFLYDDTGAVVAGQPPPALDLTMWRSMRFIGSMDANINTGFGRALFPPAEPAAGFVPLDLPLEAFSYLVFLGDYHPPLGGFLLLLVALACIGVLERQPAERFPQAVLAGTLPLTLITNAWVMPFHAALLLGWLLSRYWRRRPPDWPIFAGAGLAGGLLIYPALAGLAAHALSPGLRLVGADEHTPWRHFLALHWPLLALLLLSLLQRANRPLVLPLALTWGGLLLFSELVYIDDPYDGQFSRFNSVLKWWGWIQAGGLLTLGALNLAGDSPFARRACVLILLLLATYSVDVARLWWWQAKPLRGQLHGHGWLTADAGRRDLLIYLQGAAPGIVLERTGQGAYAGNSAFALFAGQPALLGWPDHEWTWRGSPRHVRLLTDEIGAFYGGTLNDSQGWLLHSDVRYIVWTEADDRLAPGAFATLAQQIGQRYYWQAFQDAGNDRIGLWIRRAQN